MTTETPSKNVIDSTQPVKEFSTLSNSISNPSSFSNYIDQNAIQPFKSFLKENIKSFNLLHNEENSSKENELENSLMIKYNFDTPTLEISLKITTDYESIKQKVREFFDMFGEINLLTYCHNANSVKINYKHYYSCLYANKTLTNILQNNSEANNAINYYNCDFSSKSINTTFSSENIFNKNNSNKDTSQTFKFLNDNYNMCTKFKGLIDEKKENEDDMQDDIDPKNNDVAKNYNIEERLNNTNKESFAEHSFYTNNKSKYKWTTGSISESNFFTKKNLNKSLSSSMNNMLFPHNLFYQYYSMNDPNTVKIPIPVPVPVPFPLPLSSKKLNAKNLRYNSVYASLSKHEIKSSCLASSKNNISSSFEKTKMETNSNKNNDDINDIKIESNDIPTLNDNAELNDSKSNEQKENLSPNNIEKKESNENLEGKNNSSNANLSGKSSEKNDDKNKAISSIKPNDKSNIDFLGSIDNKKMSLDSLNHFLQNNKPISNFNNPSKNLNEEDNSIFNFSQKSLPLPPIFPFSMPFMFPKIKNGKMFDDGFNKCMIDFDKLTLNTKNTIKFETYSSREYLYKYVCNYLIQIENDSNFFVTKRIIGKNGCFLKKIIQESCIKYGDFSTKVRLRGRGSGYLEHNGQESEEPLMLCISSLNYPTYFNCCLLIEKLITKIYNDYNEYLIQMVPDDLKGSVQKKEVIKNEYIVNRFANFGKNKDKNSNRKNNNDDKTKK